MLELFIILGSALDKITASLCDLKSRLDSRTCVAPDVFAENMKLREDTHHLGKNIKLLIYINIHPIVYWRAMTILNMLCIRISRYLSYSQY